MSIEGMSSGDYVHYYDEQWGAVSKRKHLNDMDWLANSVEYFVNGNPCVVTQLKLRLEVFKVEKVADAHALFTAYVWSIFPKVSNDDFPVEITIAIMEGTKVSVDFGQWRLSVDKSKHYTDFGGYSLYFVIKHKEHKSKGFNLTL